jgi:sec-independent protein translocase protein TatA
MGSFSLTHWLLVLAVVLIVFGAGRLPKAMGDFARGIRAFRSGMRDDAGTESGAEQPVEAPPAERSGDRSLP